MFKKKYETEKLSEMITAGDCLRRRREERQLSLEEVSRELGIKRSYLESLESGDYRELPPSVYVRGFIRRYAGLLGIDGGQLIKIYNRETSYLGEEETRSRKEKPRKIAWRDYLVVTPKLITFVASLGILLVLGYYFLHQLDSFNSKPYLFVATPAADQVVSEKDLLVSGQTESDAILRINGQDVSVDSAGAFRQTIALSEGRNLLVIEARNRFDRTESRQVNIVYVKPAEPAPVIREVPAEEGKAVGPVAEEIPAEPDPRESRSATPPAQ